MKNKVAIVAPCHIPPTKDWIFALEREAKFGNADVIIVDDSNGKLGELPKDWKIYTYPDQKEFLEELYEDFAKMFHKSSACRVFGHIVAYASGYDFVIGLDSDCVVPFHFVSTHIGILNRKKAYGWTNPLGSSGFFSRGFPYSMRQWQVKANMGMWDNVLDLYGRDRQPNEPKRVNAPGYNMAIAPLPFSGMNFAITRDVLFGFLFLPNFTFNEATQPITDSKQWKFSRHDDIWGGYIFQQLLRKLKFGTTFGQPVVFHDTVVVKEEDEAEEEAMYWFEDSFINIVDDTISEMLLTGGETKITDYMISFINEWKTNNIGFIDELTPAFEWWAKVINKYANI